MTADQIGGEYVWYVPDGYYPETSTGDFPSHEALCVLNTNEEDAHITIELYFEDREPMEGFEVLCKGKRTQHIRMDRITNKDGEGVPKGVPYAMVVKSDQRIIAQYSRMDTTQPAMALMTTMAYPLK
ncbi:MAG: sensory rhodopsin transducer [Mahellales bacterium]|jgi:hypothetical protein